MWFIMGMSDLVINIGDEAQRAVQVGTELGGDLVAQVLHLGQLLLHELHPEVLMPTRQAELDDAALLGGSEKSHTIHTKQLG
jgi:hypothetical protein